MNAFNMHWLARPVQLLIMANFLLMTGCAATYKARNVEPSGFLREYSQLREGTGDEANLVYINPKADFKKYNQIILEPIKPYAGTENSTLSKLPREDLKSLLDYFDAALRENLGTNYAFVSKSGPSAMRFRIALTEADSSNVPMDVVSSILPIGVAVSALRRAALGRAGSVGSVTAEFEALDSVTGKRLFAAVDRQIGKKYTGRFDKLDEWHAAQSAFDTWAQRLKTRLDELRQPNSN